MLLVERNDSVPLFAAPPDDPRWAGDIWRTVSSPLVRKVVEPRPPVANATSGGGHFRRPSRLPLRLGLANAVGAFLALRPPQSRGALPIKLGLMLYDAIPAQANAAPAPVSRSRATKPAFPELRPGCGFRLPITTPDLAPRAPGCGVDRSALKATRSYGAELCAMVHGAREWADRWRDGHSLPVSARMIVNGTGPGSTKARPALAHGLKNGWFREPRVQSHFG